MLALWCIAACTSQKSPTTEQQKEPLAAGQQQQIVSTAGQPPTAAAAERTASASPTPAARPERNEEDLLSAKDLKKALGSMPDSVLVGTDVTPLSEFLSSARRIPVPGVFRSEQGGATAEVELEMEPSGPVLTRRFAEPGTDAQTKRYAALRGHSQGVRLSSDGLEVLGVAESILVLERSSGVDGIPDSLWIQYDFVQPNGGENQRR